MHSFFLRGCTLFCCGVVYCIVLSPPPVPAPIPSLLAVQVVSDLKPNKIHLLPPLQQPSMPLSKISYVMQDGGGKSGHTLRRPARHLLLLAVPLRDCGQKRIHRLSRETAQKKSLQEAAQLMAVAAVTTQ